MSSAFGSPTLPMGVSHFRAAPPYRAAPPCRAAPPYSAALPCPIAVPAATTATAAIAATATMASPTILTFDAEGRAIDFDVHLPSAERAHFGQYKTAKSLYDAVVARYSSLATAALSCPHTCSLTLPPLPQSLTSLLTSALGPPAPPYRAAPPCRAAPPYSAALPCPIAVPAATTATAAIAATATMASPTILTFDAEGRAIDFDVDHILSLCPTELTVDLLEERLTAAEKSIVAVGASRGNPCAPFFEGCSPVPHSPLLLLLLLSTSLAQRSGLRLLLVGGAATVRARKTRVVEGTVGAAVEAVEEAEGVAVEVGVVAGVGPSVVAVGVVEAAAAAVEAAVAVVEVAAPVELVEVEPRSVEALVVASASSSRVPVRPRRPSSFVNGTLGVGGLGVLVPALMFFAPAGAVGRRAGCHTLRSAASVASMYAVTDSAEGHCYQCVPPDPGIEAAALGASASAAPGTSESAALGAGESALSGTAPTEALHTFTLDSGASRSFFRDSTTLTPLSRPVAVSLADPSGGLVLAHSSTVLPCPAAPSGLLSGLHLPSFSTNLVSGADLQDLWSGSRVWSSPASAPCSCRPLSHKTLLWHHCLSHPSMPRLRGMASRTLVSGLPRSLPPLPPGPAPTCVPCVEGRQRAAPHSSEFPRTEAPLQNLHMDVWGPGRVSGQSHERYFLLVVDDYSRYTIVFPLRRKGEVTEVLIEWIRSARRQLSESFGSDLPVMRLHSHRGGVFSSDLLRAFCHAEGIRQTFTLPASPHQNGIAERRIGMVMDVARTGPAPSGVSQVDAVEPVEVAADSGASRGAEPGCVESAGAEPGSAESGGAEPGGAEPGGAGSGGAELERAEPGGAASGGAEPGAADSGGVEPAGTGPGGPSGAFRAAGAGGAASATGGTGAGGATGAGTGRSTSTGGAGATGPGGARNGGTGVAGPTGAPGAGAGGAAGVGATGGTGAGAGVSAGGPAGAGAAGGTGTGGAAGVGADAGGASVVPAGSGGAARPRPYFVPLLEQVLGLLPSFGPAPSFECPPPVHSESHLQLASPLPAPSPYAGPTGGLAECREPESRPASPVCTARTSCRVPRPRPPAVPGTHPMALRPSTAPQRVPLPSPPASSLPALADPASDSLRAASPTITRLLATIVTDPSFESTAVSALVTELVDFAAHCRLDFTTSLVAESASVCPPSVKGECALSTDVLEDQQEEFQCFAAALPHLVSTLLAPEGDPDAPDIPTPHSYAEAIEGPYSSQWQAAMDAEMASWKSAGTYVDEVPPPGANIVSGMWIFRVKRPPGSPPVFKARYVARGFSQRQGVDYFQTFSPTPKMTTLRVLLHVTAQRDYELHSLDFSTAFLQGSLHEEIWLRRPPGFNGSFPPGTQWSLRRPVYGLHQAPREWHDTLRTTLAALGFAPSTADPSLFLRTDTLLPLFYILVYVDDLVFATADTARLAHVKFELQKRHTCTDLGELRSYLGLQITRDRARRTITLTQSHMVQQVLQRFDFTYSSPQATPLSTRHLLSALPSDESVEPSGPYPELVGCLMYLMTCTRPDLAYPQSILARYVAPGRHRPEHMAAAKRVLRYLCTTSGLGLVLGGRSQGILTGHANASWVDDLATQRSSQGYTFSLGSGSVSWRSTRSSSVLSSSCEAEIYAGAMDAQELRWLTYLLTDLGEPPRSPPVLYVDNKAMLALCREHRLEHRTKHIALHYFLARELQQRGQLRLAYVASQANTADIFTKALQPCDH
ncbi:unnamed protein product [Closterium sp. NIES-54]